MKALRIAFLGGGTMALRQAAALVEAGLPRTGLVAVYDRDPAVARAFADRFGSAPVSSSRVALQAASHVVIATTAGAHAHDAFEALQMRRGVFVEKPLALTVRDGAALTVLAERLSLPLHVGLSERFHPVIRALAAELDGRRVERIACVRHVVSMRARDCSVAMNLAVHDIDLALELVHGDLELDAHRSATSASHFDAQLLGTHGEAVRIVAANHAPAAARTISVTTGNVRYEGDLLAGSLTKHVFGLATPIPVAHANGLVSQAAALLDVWTGRSALGPATARDAFRGLALLARATRAAATDRAAAPENLPPCVPFG